MKSIYKYYKERLIEISGKNRSLYSKNLSKKYAYDIGSVIGNDEKEFDEFFSFLWKGKRSGYQLLRKDAKERLAKNFDLEKKIKASFIDTKNMSTEEKRNENLRRERVKKEESKKLLLSQVSQLKSLKREIEEFAKETGRYEMFVGYPFVTGYINKDMQIKGPLILFPVVINVEDDQTVTIEAKQDELVQFNKVLILAYAKEHRLNYDGLIMEFDNLVDYKLKKVSDVIDYLSAYGFKFDYDDGEKGLVKFDSIPEPTSKMDNLKVVNACVIGRFPLANAIYNDYSLLEKRRLTSDAIDQLLEGKNGKKIKKVDESVYTINDLDYAQENAIAKLNESGNLVIYGPPGTGKSQTIVNIISDALCKNKKVLVVSQKKAALDVVFNRLKNLNSKCMFITDAEKNKVEFYERCNKIHQALANGYRPTEERYDEFKQVEENLKREVGELEIISNTLFTKTPFGLSLQEMYANSARIGKTSNDYVLYKQMLKNHELMKMDYKRLYSTLRVIKEKNKSNLYYRYIELKKNNPLIDHIRADVDIHVINQMKTYLNGLIQRTIIPFDTAKHPHARQLMVYMLENDIEDNKKIKPLVKMISKIDYPDLNRALSWSKVLFPAYPFVKYKLNKKEKEISAQFENTLNDIHSYISNYNLLEKVLDRKGYLMTVDNIVNGNSIFLKLLLNALDDYVEIRDVNVSLQGLTDDEKTILNFAYSNSKNLRGFQDVVNSLLEIRIYHEAVTYEELNKDKLSKIIDFENIRNRIMSLKEDEKRIANEICIDKFKQEYIDHYNNDPDNKNYLYQITKQQGLMPIRKMMELYGDYLLKLFPCWLLSPESVSTIFPLKRNLFDIILFDEASQVFIENTLPTIYRGKYIVVAGDSKQLRPTQTFMKRYLGGDDDDLDLATQAALEVESLLDLATSRYTSANLTYHYRSKNEELINFSNYAFYDGKLQIAPNISKNIGSKPIERIKVNGKWIGRRNQEEANAIVSLLKKLIKNKRNKNSIGIITFNTEQENAIEDAIDKECQKDSAFRDAYIREQNRKDNGEDTSIFIKNLENVQGDERDIIIFSIGYARNEYGRVVAHFGSLSVEGGENRLNVAITRAKEKIYVVTSIEPEELAVEGTKNAGPKIFKSYLKYVRAISNKKYKEAQFVLDSFKPALPQTSDVIVENNLEKYIKDELTRLGYTVETNLGNTDYKLSLGVYDKTLDRYILGIECDYSAYKSSDSILERDVYRNKFLQSRGWKIMRVWSRDWWLNKTKVINNIVKTINATKKELEAKAN